MAIASYSSITMDQALLGILRYGVWVEGVGYAEGEGNKQGGKARIDDGFEFRRLRYETGAMIFLGAPRAACRSSFG